MIAVIFEAVPQPGKKAAYLDIAARLRPLLEGIDGFLSVERFESLATPGIFAEYRLRVARVSREIDSLQQQPERDAGRDGLHP